ncbi:MAG: hypothetical protein SFZ03_05185 [Candidatus Melainabacteria bacterium]|nr:hypothetical protein [Candidatus Melainabacteria bacterium]
MSSHVGLLPTLFYSPCNTLATTGQGAARAFTPVAVQTLAAQTLAVQNAALQTGDSVHFGKSAANFQEVCFEKAAAQLLSKGYPVELHIQALPKPRHSRQKQVSLREEHWSFRLQQPLKNLTLNTTHVNQSNRCQHFHLPKAQALSAALLQDIARNYTVTAWLEAPDPFSVEGKPHRYDINKQTLCIAANAAQNIQQLGQFPKPQKR